MLRDLSYKHALFFHILQTTNKKYDNSQSKMRMNGAKEKLQNFKFHIITIRFDMKFY